jgi:hypothetical protein
MKRLFNRSVIIGLILTPIGYLLAFDVGHSLVVSVEAPSSLKDNLHFALPLFLAKLLLGPGLVMIVGAISVITGGIYLLIGLFRAIWPKKHAAPLPHGAVSKARPRLGQRRGPDSRHTTRAAEAGTPVRIIKEA